MLAITFPPQESIACPQHTFYVHRPVMEWQNNCMPSEQRCLTIQYMYIMYTCSTYIYSRHMYIVCVLVHVYTYSRHMYIVCVLVHVYTYSRHMYIACVLGHWLKYSCTCTCYVHVT